MSTNDQDARGRRATERVEFACLAWVEGQRDEAISGIARTVDLSSQGVGLLLATTFEPGVRVTVELLMPAHLRLRASGEVAHVTPATEGFRVGVRFDAPPTLVD
jgi:hypothetical protein